MCIDEGGNKSGINIAPESWERSGLVSRNGQGTWQISGEGKRAQM